jgi:hypothetical protein
MTNVTINALPTASTIDAVNDILPIYTASSTATQGINRNVFLGISSGPVGLTDSQTLTNKVLTSPTISGPTLSGTVTGTYTIGGTPTFPSSVVTLTSSQTLTNKVLTSPTINSPTITNATISADTVSGFSTSNSGTVYGISVTTGQITNAAIANGTIGSTQIATNGVAASNLATNAITLGYVQITGNISTTSTSFTQATGLTVTVTIPTGGRRVKVTFQAQSANNAATGIGSAISIWRGTVGSGTQIGSMQWTQPVGAYQTNANLIATDTPSAGSVTYNVGYLTNNGADAVQIVAAATSPAFILVEAI